MKRFGAALALASALTFAFGLSAFADGTVSDNVFGFELPGATATTGSFVGSASGELPGIWTATIQHDDLSGTSNDTDGATQPELVPDIEGGTFQLVTSVNGQFITVRGVFNDSGSITPVPGAAGSCPSRKQYAILGGTLTLANGTGSFNALLTHYQVLLPTGCTTYFATVQGTVTLPAPAA